MNLPRIINKFLLRHPNLYVKVHKSGWYGNFSSWEEASKKATGYDADIILQTVKASLLKVKNGEAVYERDSVLFDKIEYSWELLASFIWIASHNEWRLNLIDFGGSLGSTYFQNKKLLDSFSSVKWNIIEQPNFVEEGKCSFENETLKFYSSIDECINASKETIQIALFSGVLQYLKQPYSILEQVIKENIQYIIITRTRFTLDNTERITVQKIPHSIYNASYPCHLLNEKEVLSFFEKHGYECLADFQSPESINIPSTNKGLIFKKLT